MTKVPALTINHVAIAAPEPERSMMFYEAFGFRPGFVRRDAGSAIALQQMQRDGQFVELLADISAPADGHFGLHTSDLTALLHHLEAHAATYARWRFGGALDFLRGSGGQYG
ncbi:VOC family protein [Litoreibacter albidus]|uniref:VOC family protein n=1 Tax=Litoreibacter albidus TaxID=670155 RepID=UPI003735AAD1